MKITRQGNKLTPTLKYKAFGAGLTCLIGILAYIAYAVLDSIFWAGLLTFIFLNFIWINFRFLFDQIEIEDERVRMRHAFKVNSIDRNKILSITRETGMGIIFKLKDGKVLYGPDLGNATSTCNILKTWLRKENAKTA